MHDDRARSDITPVAGVEYVALDPVLRTREPGRFASLLAEVEWPPALPCPPFRPDDVARARSRLGFFARLGARALAIDYVQPALASHLQAVPWLRLLLLPGRPPTTTTRCAHSSRASSRSSTRRWPRRTNALSIV